MFRSDQPIVGWLSSSRRGLTSRQAEGDAELGGALRKVVLRAAGACALLCSMSEPIVIASTDELPSGSLLGPYRVLRVLGKGGMGIVYEAVHTTIQRRVAIKVLRRDLATDRERAARFVNEARAVNLIEHPGAVQVADLGEQPDGAPYIVMEFLRGETLAALLKRRGSPLPWREVVGYAQQILDVLRAAHQRNIIHRDLKPENVMLVEDAQLPGGMRVKVLDFGIAKLLDEANASHFKTKTGALMGSPAYMSPEQCKGSERITAQSDLYSLGILMYELLSGQLPHVADGPGHMVVLHMFGAPRPLRHLARGLPDSLYVLLDDLLQKQPEARPQGDQLALRFATILRKGDGLGERVQTWGLGLCLGLAISAGVGTGIAKARTGRYWWQAQKSQPAVPSASLRVDSTQPAATTAPKRAPAPSAAEKAEPMHPSPPRPRSSGGSVPRGASTGTATSFAPVDVSKERQAPPMAIKPVR